MYRGAHGCEYGKENRKYRILFTHLLCFLTPCGSTRGDQEGTMITEHTGVSQDRACIPLKGVVGIRDRYIMCYICAAVYISYIIQIMDIGFRI